MKILSTTAAAAVLAAGLAAPASAALFSGSFSVGGSALSDPGLVVKAAPNPGTVNANLDVGESTTFHIFTIWTDETTVQSDDMVDQSIEVSFNFSSPVTDGTLSGTSDGKVSGCFFGVCPTQYGTVSWNNPLELSFGPGDTGKASISMSDEEFNKGFFFGTKEGEKYGAKVYATLSYDVAPVPLPAAGFVLLGALAAAGVAYRRRAA